jgi:hypothetical protein
MAPGVFWTLWGFILGDASVFPVGSNGCLRLRGRGDTDLGGVTGGRFKLCKVVSNAESRVSKSGPGLAVGLGGKGEGLRGPRGRLPDATRGAALSVCSLTPVSGVGTNRFVGVVERWLRPLPEARDDGRNGSGGLSMGIFNMMQETSNRQQPSYIVSSTGLSHGLGNGKAEGGCSTGPLEP